MGDGGTIHQLVYSVSDRADLVHPAKAPATV
jgi:hypothetical protein